ncbi:MAG: TIGR03761 family integrating conjugative element protein [Gammaproteobacteria bacterium]|nr:TIGR03761 family integrating conjugative element protein [Gammaproteobacteria bacterium]MCP5135429.1 TIGR03761 family integrating conjugative element protein [Gammaproteobacteria bacterium]
MTEPQATAGVAPHSDNPPGGLVSETTMVVHTRTAFMLVDGRRRDDDTGKHGIIGLRQAGAALRNILAGYRDGDPYADWMLVRVHESLTEKAEYLSKLLEGGRKLMASRPGVTAEPGITRRPATITLRFNNPYGFRCAYLLQDLDTYVRTVRTLAHIGFLERERAHRLIGEASSAVRHAFILTQGYRFTGVSHADFEHNTKRAREAVEKYGEIPSEILTGTVVAPFAPPRLPVFNRGMAMAQHERDTETNSDMDFKVDGEVDEPADEEVAQ